MFTQCERFSFLMHRVTPWEVMLLGVGSCNEMYCTELLLRLVIPYIRSYNPLNMNFTKECF